MKIIFITNIILPSPDDGSLEQKRHSVDFASPKIAVKKVLRLLHIFGKLELARLDVKTLVKTLVKTSKYHLFIYIRCSVGNTSSFEF